MVVETYDRYSIVFDEDRSEIGIFKVRRGRGARCWSYTNIETSAGVVRTRWASHSNRRRLWWEVGVLGSGERQVRCCEPVALQGSCFMLQTTIAVGPPVMPGILLPYRPMPFLKISRCALSLILLGLNSSHVLRQDLPVFVHPFRIDPINPTLRQRKLVPQRRTGSRALT